MIWCSRNIYYYNQCLKCQNQLCCLIFCWNNFQHSLDRKLKRTAFMWNIVQDLSVTTSYVVTTVGLQTSCVIKNWRKAKYKKYWNVLIRTARWVVSQTNVSQRTNPGKHFRRTFIISVDVCCLLIGRQNRPTLLQSVFSSFCSLGSCKTTLKRIPPVCAKHQVFLSDLI